VRRDCLLVPQLAGMPAEHSGDRTEQDHERDAVSLEG
jgi:hypothetical protein